MWVSIPTGLTVKFKATLGILQTSVENGLFVYFMYLVHV